MMEEELRRLAADRPLHTRELQAPNDFYGIAAMLKRHAGVSPRAALKAAVEHGISVSSYVWELDVEGPLPTFLGAGPQRVQAYLEAAEPGRAAEAIGPLVLYAPAPRPVERPARRLLAIPAHSTHHVTVDYDAEAFAAWLGELRGDFDEVVVCLYWRDVQRGAQEAYRRAGLRCATAGHIYDPLFMTRMRALLESAAVVATNRFGSHVAYAVALDRPVWYRAQPVERTALEALPESKAAPEWLATAEQIAARFARPVDAVTDEQREALDPFAGFERHRSPEELRRLLADAAQRYRRHWRPLRRAEHAARRSVREALVATRAALGR
ncbi:MAG TPA: hypothetical protein VHB30_12750 [Solirubrobacteraceae bacterium]|jgi:hypothetical protein|nr:hypothetical protein [Solirubrobacteraceae bacterium]